MIKSQGNTADEAKRLKDEVKDNHRFYAKLIVKLSVVNKPCEAKNYFFVIVYSNIKSELIEAQNYIKLTGE